MIVNLQLKAWLEDGKDVRLGDWKAADVEILNTFQLLTAKPVVYLVSFTLVGIIIRCTHVIFVTLYSYLSTIGICYLLHFPCQTTECLVYLYGNVIQRKSCFGTFNKYLVQSVVYYLSCFPKFKQIIITVFTLRKKFWWNFYKIVCPPKSVVWRTVPAFYILVLGFHSVKS